MSHHKRNIHDIVIELTAVNKHWRINFGEELWNYFNEKHIHGYHYNKESKKETR